MNKQTEITLILVAIAVLANLLMVRGLVKRKPPGQRGLSGTGLERNQSLLWVQIASLAALEVASLIGMYLI
jgi:hypothetical protein